MRHETAVEFIKERAGKSNMTKTERLELENEVLKNVIACIEEKIEIVEKVSEKDALRKIKATLNYNSKMELAVKEKKIIDYRLSAETLGSCERRFECLKSRIILNDGMVMGIEY